MKNIVLISCVKRKMPFPSRAELLYTSALFKFSLEYARRLNHDAIYILSAAHGLVSLQQELAPYNQTLRCMTKVEKIAWAQTVLRQMEEVCSPATDHFTILAGRHYYEGLLPFLPHHALALRNLTHGKRLQFLKEQLALLTYPATPQPL